MLALNTTNRITFTVNVQGTAMEPTVRCVVGEKPSFMYDARSIGDSKFESLIELPLGTVAGNYKLQIEVLLNGKLFTPINTTVQIGEAKIESVQTVETKNEPVEQKIETPVSVEQKSTSLFLPLKSLSLVVFCRVSLRLNKNLLPRLQSRRFRQLLKRFWQLRSLCRLHSWAQSISWRSIRVVNQ
jgi:hypothetical protein